MLMLLWCKDLPNISLNCKRWNNFTDDCSLFISDVKGNISSFSVLYHHNSVALWCDKANKLQGSFFRAVYFNSVRTWWNEFAEVAKMIKHWLQKIGQNHVINWLESQST